MGRMTNRPLSLVERLIVEHYPRLAGLVQETRARRPAILDEQWPAIVSYLDGHAKPLRSFVKKHIGGPPRPFYFSALEEKNIGDLDEIETWEVIEYHRKQLENSNKGQDVLNQAPSIRQGIRKYESVNLALDSLSVRGQSREQVLREMIPGVAYVERSKSPPPANLPGKVANQIRREGLERPDDPGKVFALGLDSLLGHADEVDDDVELATFAVCEQLAHMAEKAGVSEQEWESFVFGTVFGNQEAAEILDRPAKQVGVEKFRASNKLHPPA